MAKVWPLGPRSQPSPSGPTSRARGGVVGLRDELGVAPAAEEQSGGGVDAGMGDG